MDEIMTVEERVDGPEPGEHEVVGRVESIKSQLHGLRMCYCLLSGRDLSIVAD